MQKIVERYLDEEAWSLKEFQCYGRYSVKVAVPRESNLEILYSILPQNSKHLRQLPPFSFFYR